MNCKETRKFLSAFMDNELDVRTNVEILEHLEMCQACAARLEGLRDLHAAVASSIAQIVPPEGLERRCFGVFLVDEGFVHRWIGSGVRRLAHSGVFRMAAAAASILLVFGVVYGTMVRSDPQYSSKAILAHIAVIEDQITHFYSTQDPERARRLALFKMASMPEVPLVGEERFELMGAGPQEIGFREAGHFAFRYGSRTVSMFVFDRLDLGELGGEMRQTRLGATKLEKRGDFGVVAWRRGGFTYVLVARMDPAELLDMVGPRVF